MTIKTLEKKRNGKTRIGRARREKARVWTYDELLAKVGETVRPMELWEGELIVSPTPNLQHQIIVFRLARALDDFVLARKLGQVFISPMDVVLTARRVVQPDVIYVSHRNDAILKDRVRGVPDLVVEVISRGSWRRDRIEKKNLYEQFGVAEYWIVDPEANVIEVFALEEGSYHLVGRFAVGEKARSQLLTGFEMAVEEIAE